MHTSSAYGEDSFILDNKYLTVIGIENIGIGFFIITFATVPYFLFIAVIVYLAICYMKMPTL